MFINGRQVAGALPLEFFLQVADEELAAADALLKKGVKRKELYMKLLELADPPVKEDAGARR